VARRIVDAMSDTKSNVVIIVGSVREGRFGPVVASWVADRARRHGAFQVTVIDLADVDIPLSLPAVPPKYAGDAYPRPLGMGPVTAALDGADAFIIVTPEYNHSYPASLKALIDWQFTQWTAKPVAFVSYGRCGGQSACRAPPGERAHRAACRDHPGWTGVPQLLHVVAGWSTDGR
jgi:NAD(P)H-dependent FMN reductase